MACDQPRSKVVQCSNVDIISDLPGSVIETILMHLPTRDAARTYVLSKKWRYRWVKVPQLILDDALWQQSMRDQHIPRAKFAMMVSQILLYHRGPITKLVLSFAALGICPEIDALICYVSRNGIQDFTLEFGIFGKCVGCPKYELPASFFLSLQLQLRRLSLRFCVLDRLPSPFRGFSELVTLELIHITIATEVLEQFVSNCPSLEHLVLITVNTLERFEIHSPKLKLLYMCCDFECERKKSSIVDLFNNFPALEVLVLFSEPIKDLISGGSPTRLPNSLGHLKEVRLCSICLDDVHLLSCTLCLILNSPNLQKFKISCDYPVRRDGKALAKYFETQDCSSLTLNHLLEVKMSSVSGKEAEMLLIKLLLARSPHLKTMTIRRCPYSDKGLNFMNELVSFQRVAPNVRVSVV